MARGTSPGVLVARVALCALVLGGVLGGALGVVIVPSSAHDRVSQVTWTTDIEPILRSRCIGCHASGGFGPMSLETYAEARGWAAAIREEVLEQRMPPWPAAKGFGAFINDRSLTPIEIELLAAWAAGATPLGPAVTSPVAGAESHRAPDLVLSVPENHEVRALVERIELPTNLATDRWITGWEVRPGNRSLVEQAVVSLAPATVIGIWTPPDDVLMFPRGVGQRLPARARVVLELHYRKSASAQHDQTSLAFYFGARPHRQLEHRLLSCGVSPVDRAIDALAISPRAAEAGASIEVVARNTDGSVEPLAVVARYQPAYPIAYRFQTQVALRHGSTIEVRSPVPGCSAMLDFVAAPGPP